MNIFLMLDENNKWEMLNEKQTNKTTAMLITGKIEVIVNMGCDLSKYIMRWNAIKFHIICNHKR